MTKGERTGMSNWLKVLLFGSLAVNLLIVGVFVGAVVLRGPGGGGDPRLRDVGLGPLRSVLSVDQRRDLRTHLAAHEHELTGNRNAMRAAIGGILSALRADPFDPNALEQALAVQRGVVGERQIIGHRALMERIGAASQAERLAIADRMERGLHRSSRRR